jgi:hypothetical protein
MKERSAVFKDFEVRAILRGSKTQHRWVLKNSAPPEATSAGVFFAPGKAYDAEWNWLSGDPHDCDSWCSVGDPFRCPYGQPGDRLWVREAWQAWCDFDNTAPRDIPVGSDIQYPATYDGWVSKIRPSIHMPRWASRITLEVTGVRVERLQDISEADALAEGVAYSMLQQIQAGQDRWARHAYQRLWESINDDGSWAANPFVWVGEFERVQR